MANIFWHKDLQIFLKLLLSNTRMAEQLFAQKYGNCY